MIRFRLRCDGAHEFDAWFQSGSAYDTQHKRGLLSCPECGSSKVEKALMAPGIATGSRGSEAASPEHDFQLPAAGSAEAPRAELAAGAVDPRFVEMVRRLSEHVRTTAENVGDKFAEEARKIHYEETEPRGIYGKASEQEVAKLLDEGVDFFPLPQLPEDKN